MLFTSWIIYNRVFIKEADYGKAKGINFTNDKDLKDEDIENQEKHFYWYSIYLLFIISFVVLLLVSKYDNIQFLFTLFFISMYFILYMLHINYKIKKRNIKSLIFIVLLILLFGLNTYLFI
jgi:hypothetical protein